MSEGFPVEKRRNLRSSLLKGFRVSWKGNGGGLISRVSNVGVGGLFIETAEPPLVGTTIKLILETPSKRIQATAIVRRSTMGHGMGVEFLAMGDEDRTCLQDLLKAAGPFRAHAKTSTADGPALGELKKAELPNVQSDSVPPPLERVRADNPAPRKTEHRYPTTTDNAKVAMPAARPDRHPERRAHPRYKLTALTELMEIESGKKFKAQLINLGRAGCYLKAERSLPVGTAVGICITHRIKSFHAHATIVSAMPGKGMGLTFTAIEPNQLETLDTWLERSMESAWLVGNRRKNQRLLLSIPVQISGNNRLGQPFTEETHTITISANGASIPLSVNVDKGQRLMLSNLRTKTTLECVVASIIQSQGEKREVGISFPISAPAFWKVAFPPSNWSLQHPDAKRQ